MLSVPSLPKVFELEGKDSLGSVVVRYGFELKQWLVHRGNKKDTDLNQSTWCSSLGYHVPLVSDLTNSNCTSVDSLCQGATLLSSVNYYQRQIGSGFFTEWGRMNYYANAGFVSNYYLATDATGSKQFMISSNTGKTYSSRVYSQKYALCIVP